MDSYIYEFPSIPPSYNKFAGRVNAWEYRNLKKQWEDIVLLCITEKPPKPLSKAIVKIIYHFPDNRRRDPDNYAGKMILDGLVRAGVIKDDSFKNIQLLLTAEFGKKTAKTFVEIESKI